MEIKKINFEKYSSVNSWFIAGKIEGFDNLRYFIYPIRDGIEIIDPNFNKIKSSSVENAKIYCQKDFDERIKNLIEK